MRKHRPPWPKCVGKGLDGKGCDRIVWPKRQWDALTEAQRKKLLVRGESRLAARRMCTRCYQKARRDQALEPLPETPVMREMNRRRWQMPSDELERLRKLAKGIVA